MAAGVLAEVQDISRFPNQAALAKFAGLTWRKSESGNFKAKNTRLSKSGNRYLRYYLVEAANSMRVHNMDYRSYYQRKHTESSTHKHKRALVLTARKLVRLINALLRKNELYTMPVRSVTGKEVQSNSDSLPLRPAKHRYYHEASKGLKYTPVRATT